MASVITFDSLSAQHKRQIAAMKPGLLQAARNFGAVRARLGEIAPKAISLYNSIVAARAGFTFVDFVRMFDHTVPTHAGARDGVDGYRNHRTYYTLQYMRRLVQATNTPRRGTPGGVRDSATDALARTLATVLQIVDDQERVWSAIQSEFAFTERLMTRLRKRVDATEPLIKLEAKTPAKIGKVIHMDRMAQEEADEPMRQRGRSVEIPAKPKRAKAA